MTVTIHPRPQDVPTKAEIEPWRAVPVAVAVDLAPDEQLDVRIRPINPPGRQPRLFGRAVTVRCEPPDFGAVVHALELVGPGDVLVIAAMGLGGTAMIGEILAGHLRARGCAGVVCDGPVRDVATLAGWSDFAVFARSVNPRGPTSATEGAVNAPVMIGDRQVGPGDLVIGDDDGLVALSPATVRSRIGDAEAKLALEAKWIEALASGRPVAEIFGLSPARQGGAD
jgi:4-hydroxy-4-methyl-2-oxoglutarate aldolase